MFIFYNKIFQMPDNNAPVSPQGASHQTDVQQVDPSSNEREEEAEYEVEKVVGIKPDRYDRNNDLFEVVWEGYPGQNTWQTRAQLFGARYRVAQFEHPQMCSRLTERQIQAYGVSQRQAANSKKV